LHFTAFAALAAIVSGLVIVSSVIGGLELVLEQNAATAVKFQKQVRTLDDFFRHRRVDGALRRDVMRCTAARCCCLLLLHGMCARVIDD
jgi:hypothetical protein